MERDRGGGVLIGKTRTHEFALGILDPAHHEPVEPAHIPGGSSGGVPLLSPPG